jgi:penicillin-binding protein 1A
MPRTAQTAPPRRPRSTPATNGAKSAKAKRDPLDKKRSIFWRWRRGLFLIGLLLLAALAGAGYIVSRIQLPPARVLAQTSFVCAADVVTGCDANNALWAAHAEQDRVDVPLSDVPDVMIDATLAAEDREFFRHGGVDPVGIVRAAWADIRSKGSTQGGSTITQQYVKNVYLTNERTLNRKIKEAVLSVKLEQKLSKQEILERYLNTVYFGRGAYGVGAAARTYFGVPVAQLNLPQAAYLAGLIRSPESADAERNPQAATFRRKTVLDAMVEEHYITPAQRDEAAAVPWVVDDAAPIDFGKTILSRKEQASFGDVRDSQFGTQYFVTYVYRELHQAGFTDAEIYSGGLRIYTTLDYRLQQAAYESIRSTLDQPDDPAAALVAVDPDGHIVAMVGGTDFAQSQVNYALGAAGGGSGRQAGSSMKPFVLAEAVREGISVQSKFKAPPEIVIPKANAGGPWDVHNYGDESFGVQTLIQATQHSVNTVYAQLMVQVGPVPVVKLAQDMGVKSPLEAFNALALGSEDVSPLDMASAYSTFADGGTHVDPIGILRVERPDGSIVDFTNRTRLDVLTRAQTNVVNYCLRQVVLGGTGTGADPGFPVAGKTGTTQDNKDAWFVGFAPNGFTTAVWMGYPNPPDQPTRYMNDVHGKHVTGGAFPATMWRKFMQAALSGVDVGTFATPSNFGGQILNPDLSATTSTASTSTTAPTTSSTEAATETTGEPTSSTVVDTTSSTDVTTATTAGPSP